MIILTFTTPKKCCVINITFDENHCISNVTFFGTYYIVFVDFISTTPKYKIKLRFLFDTNYLI